MGENTNLIFIHDLPKDWILCRRTKSLSNFSIGHHETFAYFQRMSGRLTRSGCLSPRLRIADRVRRAIGKTELLREHVPVEDGISGSQYGCRGERVTAVATR